MELHIERLIVVEGVTRGKPWRESSHAYSEADADRMMAAYQERINNPPADNYARILHAELRTRVVTDWSVERTTTGEKVVDKWLEGDRKLLEEYI